MDNDYLAWKDWGEADFGHCPQQAARYFDWHMRRAFPVASRPLHVLEIGFGNGRFLGFCRSRKHEVTGVEISPALTARAVAASFPAFSKLEDSAPRGPFDLIAAFDVLEHLDERALQHFFSRATSLLAPGGCILARVPNGDSPFGGRHQHGDLTHVTTFGEFKFRQLASTWGLEVAALGEAPWTADEFEPPSAKSALRSGVRAVIELACGFAYFRQRIRFDPNLVVVLRRSDARA